MLNIRLAEDRDAEGMRAVYEAVYGDEYTYPEYYDLTYLKRLIFSDSTVFLVAESDGRIVGTAAVVLERGAYTDLVGEFGRLAVHPDMQGRGIGSLLMEARLERVSERLHVGFLETRCVHPHAMRIGVKYGFAPVGFLPMNLQFGARRESTLFLVRYFGDALALRRNHPRIIPEAMALAGAAIDAVGLERDFIVDETAPPLAYPDRLDFEEMTAAGYAALVRIERGRLMRRDVFGPMRLQYGFYRLQASNSRYIVGRRDGEIVGALGFTYDAHERTARVFEVIHVEDEAIRALLEELESQCREILNVAYIEIDVSAHAPSVQRTLVELGFVPAAYVPALAFHRVERLDVVKMCKLTEVATLGAMDLLPEIEPLAEIVLKEVRRRYLAPRLGIVIGESELHDGLSSEQVQRLVSVLESATFDAGTEIFHEGAEAAEAYLIVEGEVEVHVDGQGEVGRVGPGETLGEVALLTETAHSATAVAASRVLAARLAGTELTDLVRRRPDVGVVLYRNIARGLGRKLRRADRR